MWVHHLNRTKRLEEVRRAQDEEWENNQLTTKTEHHEYKTADGMSRRNLEPEDPWQELDETTGKSNSQVKKLLYREQERRTLQRSPEKCETQD